MIILMGLLWLAVAGIVYWLCTNPKSPLVSWYLNGLSKAFLNFWHMQYLKNETEEQE